ncbi:uncharacterized protein J7T55_009490 [Diaporthe amygdali]|uniref:uncharacterized protein n=1 Tax=Phomopsis amygdali TaxID=1214568 RepID=UPI0022FDD8B7|nr:uncharacterized protein J7T55_009490 [Diaporthe amygdali]KAJ0104325.1 uncharacterized protein J7T55_009490 [Diaporthe amygdali]
MEDKSDSVVIMAECLCKAHSFSPEVSKSKLPLECNVCHCDSCRHSTGALYVVETTWPQPLEDVDLSGLHKYQFSDNIAYRFCGTCSTLMFYESRKYPSKLGTFSGPLKNTDSETIRLARHIYVEDTIDGGATVWLRKPNPDGQQIPRYLERSGEELSWDWPQISSLTGSTGKQEQAPIPLWCHCRDLSNVTQGDGDAFPKTMAKLKAAVDVADPLIGTLAYYQPTSGVQRYCCKVCSTSAFLASDDRSEAVGVPVGLLEASDGSRAESFLSWGLGDTPIGVDDTKGGWREEMIKRVLADAEKFRVARDYPRSWRRQFREANAGSS